MKSVLQNVEGRAIETGLGDRGPDLPQQWNDFRRVRRKAARYIDTQ
jgi:hypothetical protein